MSTERSTAEAPTPVHVTEHATSTASAAETAAVPEPTDRQESGETADPVLDGEIEDSPVHAPVSGTMISAHHRTARYTR